MREHDFKVIAGSAKFNKNMVMVKRYHCKACDSIVEYASTYTESDVNRMVERSTLKCLPPPEIKDYAGTEYYEKKYKKENGN